MHNVLVQCLIALVSREFSPEEFREILEETKSIPFEEMRPYWDITNQIDQARESLRARFKKHQEGKYTHREVVKDVVVKDAMPEPIDETPVDWQPREELPRMPINKGLHAKMDFS